MREHQQLQKGEEQVKQIREKSREFCYRVKVISRKFYLWCQVVIGTVNEFLYHGEGIPCLRVCVSWVFHLLALSETPSFLECCNNLGNDSFVEVGKKWILVYSHA